MASDVRVDITDRSVIMALNTPGGAIFEWRDKVGSRTADVAMGMSPVNDPLNAEHRGGVVGTYKAGWGWDRVGSNGHDVRATVYNRSDHADIVEFGRRRSYGYERFSWANHVDMYGEPTPGSIEVHGFGTSGREGQHILARATASVVGFETGGNFQMDVSEGLPYED